MARILVVDDLEVNRQFLVTLLGRAGHEIDEAADGADALARAHERRPDLVITDLWMPNMDGEDLVRRLRASPATAPVPVIYYTATYRMREAPAIAAHGGMSWVVPKPSEPLEILRTVAEALGQPAQGPAARPHPGNPAVEAPQALSLRLAGLIELASECAACRDPRELVRLMCRAARNILNAQFAGIVMEGEAGEAARFFAPDGAPDLSLPDAAPRLASLLACPIRVRGEVRGRLYAANRLAGGPFGADDERLAGTLAAQFALAWDNALLCESIERSVVARTRELQAANEALEAFSYSVSHDLRAPLRAISGFSRLIEEQHAAALPAEGRRHLARVREQAARMGELIDDLLELAGVGRRELALRPLALGEVVRACIAELAPQCAGREIEFRVGELPPYPADPRLARQLFHNLLSNAVKYTARRAHAVVEVGAEEQADGRRSVFVRDNGVGFDMARAARLFDPFQRLHAQEEFPGTGVGLAIVRRIAERHGCRLRAEAKPGEGATFWLDLGSAAG